MNNHLDSWKLRRGGGRGGEGRGGGRGLQHSFGEEGMIDESS